MNWPTLQPCAEKFLSFIHNLRFVQIIIIFENVDIAVESFTETLSGVDHKILDLRGNFINAGIPEGASPASD